MSAKERAALVEVLETLSPESIDELQRFVAYLRFRDAHAKNWFAQAYDLFADVRAEAAKHDASEIDALIDEALDEVRRG